jgi:hypothetical protein
MTQKANFEALFRKRSSSPVPTSCTYLLANDDEPIASFMGQSPAHLKWQMTDRFLVCVNGFRLVSMRAGGGRYLKREQFRRQVFHVEEERGLTGQPDGADMFRGKPRGCAKLMVFGSRHAGFRLCDSGL